MKKGEWVECVKWEGEYCKVGKRYKVFETNGGELYINGEPCCSCKIYLTENREELKPASFRVGDRVKQKPQYLFDNESPYAIITKIDGNTISHKHDGMNSVAMVTKEELELIQEGEMSKHEDLKQRIDRVTAWGEDAEGIIKDMGTLGNNFWIIIQVQNESCFSAIKIAECNPDFSNIVAGFKYDSQCSKLAAFKKALHWLLAHSDIKKDNSKEIAALGQKLYKLNEECDNIKEEIRKLK